MRAISNKKTKIIHTVSQLAHFIVHKHGYCCRISPPPWPIIKLISIKKLTVKTNISRKTTTTTTTTTTGKRFKGRTNYDKG